MSALRAVGMDGAVAYAFLARLTNIVGSTGTVLLIVRSLSSVEQGYYYTLLSLVSLQLVFELGFSFVIQQLAAHECARLELKRDGSISGEAAAHARLASALQLSVRWYSLAAICMFLLLAPFGFAFFGGHSGAANSVAWQGPWLATVLASSVSLWCMPVYSFLEGCGQVRAVAAMRLRQAIFTPACAWMALLLHHGLYSPAAALVGYIAVGAAFLATRRRFLVGLLRHRAPDAGLSWTREIFPFQWRIAVSWLCSYFVAQVLIPILFAVRGATEAGKMGMSLSITGYMGGLVLPWISTRTPVFGNLIAHRDFCSLDRLFMRTLRQALVIFLLIAILACGGIALLPHLFPRLAARMVSPWLFVVLVAAAGANCVVQSLAYLLRSFKSEPFLLQSLMVAVATLLLAALTASRWGAGGAAFSYLAATGGIALPSAIFIFVRARRGYLKPAAHDGRLKGSFRLPQPAHETWIGISESS